MNSKCDAYGWTVFELFNIALSPFPPITTHYSIFKLQEESGCSECSSFRLLPVAMYCSGSTKALAGEHLKNLLGDQKHLFLQWHSLQPANLLLGLCSTLNRTTGCFHIRPLFFLLNEASCIHSCLFHWDKAWYTLEGECLHNNQREIWTAHLGLLTQKI